MFVLVDQLDQLSELLVPVTELLVPVLISHTATLHEAAAMPSNLEEPNEGGGREADGLVI